MYFIKLFIHCLLLFSTTSLLAYPQAPVVVELQQEPLLTYDSILNLLEEIENGTLQEDEQKINQFLAHLAKEGILPDENASVEEDIEELLAYNPYGTILCKNWAEKRWAQTKKFVKKHKKAIIIGATVVVATVVVVCTVGTASGAACAATAAAAASCDREEKSKPTPSSPIETLIVEHVSAFKENLAKDELYPEDSSFEERARMFGSHLAHGTLESVSELSSVFPKLLEDTNKIAYLILPEAPPNDLYKSPIKNHETLFAFAHQKIDQVFATDMAELYTPEAKANDIRNNFVIGIIPPPSDLAEFFAIDKLLDAGKAIDRAGLTKAGRSLVKHGYRDTSVFPKPVGRREQINTHGQQMLEKILSHPEKQITPGEFDRYGKVVDIHAPEIGGVRYTIDGKFIGFLEPPGK